MNDDEKLKRIIMIFNSEAYNVLNEVSARLNINKAEVIRLSLGLIDLISRNQSEGWKAYLEKNNKIKEIIKLKTTE